jgi:hypothetical protein
METPIDDYRKEELTLDALRANVVAVLMSFPVLLVFVGGFFLVNFELLDLQAVRHELNFWATPLGGFFILLIILAGVVVHELIHGLTFALFAKSGFRSVQFGILVKSFTPYCHCKEPLRVWQYFISSIMPAIVLGFIPSIIAIITANLWLLLFGAFFTMAAAGDFIIIYLLRSLPRNTLVQDHPEKIGCIIYNDISTTNR